MCHIRNIFGLQTFFANFNNYFSFLDYFMLTFWAFGYLNYTSQKKPLVHFDYFWTITCDYLLPLFLFIGHVHSLSALYWPYSVHRWCLYYSNMNIYAFWLLFSHLMDHGSSNIHLLGFTFLLWNIYCDYLLLLLLFYNTLIVWAVRHSN